jgi:hypothetical protein
LFLKNTIEIKGGHFSREEKTALKSRLNAQLDDSARFNSKDVLFFLHYIYPPTYDTSASYQSAKNMQAAMLHLGYYAAKVHVKADTVLVRRQQRMHITYTVESNKPTLIDTVSYRISKPALQELAIQHHDHSFLLKQQPVSKSGVQGEISRLVELYRNNGYYKFTSDELKVMGDTTLDVLTNISDDPFEQLEALNNAQQMRDSPKVKLRIMLNPPRDSSKLNTYSLRNIYILPDYIPGDKLNDSTLTEKRTKTSQYIIRYHNKIFKTGFLLSNVFLRKGDIYKQDDYYKTLNALSKAGFGKM